MLTPLLADQPSWARLVHALGVGPAPLPFQRLTAERLAEAIGEGVTNPAMRQRAAELGRRIQAEDGVGRTIELFLTLCGEGWPGEVLLPKVALRKRRDKTNFDG